MSFINLVIASFFAGFGLGYIKFYMLGHLTAMHGIDAKTWIIQVVGAFITVGPCLIYIAASPLASSFRKRWLMMCSAGIVALLLVFADITDFAGSPWLYVFMAGFIMGCYNSARNASVPLTAVQTGKSTEYVNAGLNIAYLTGMMLGVPMGTKLYLSNPTLGLYFGIFLFSGAALFGSRCSYTEEHMQNFKTSLHNFIEDNKFLLKKYKFYLLIIPIIWGVVSALSLAITAYAEEAKLGDAVKCSMMAIYAIVGVAVGNAISDKFKNNRYNVCYICNLLLVIFISCIPVMVRLLASPNLSENAHVYWILVGIVVVLGILFGLTTNLIEAECFNMIYEDKKEGAGAALMSATIALACFILGGSVGLCLILGIVGPESQFIWLSIMTAFVVYLTKQWKDQQKKDNL